MHSISSPVQAITPHLIFALLQAKCTGQMQLQNSDKVIYLLSKVRFMLLPNQTSNLITSQTLLHLQIERGNGLGCERNVEFGQGERNEISHPQVSFPTGREKRVSFCPKSLRMPQSAASKIPVLFDTVRHKATLFVGLDSP